MSPKPDVSEQRIAQILEAATAVFAEKGFDRATMEDIADAVGINKATIYLYFDSKDALIRAIAETLFARELAGLRAAHELPGGAIQRLAAYYEALIAEDAEVLPLMPLLYEFYALGLRREDVRAVIADFIRQSAGLLEAIIQEGIDSGELEPTDARQAARALDALLSGTILHWVYTPEEIDVDELLRYAVRLMFQGLLNHP
ncbi:MAG: TetR/AcrR family transcriptional regulator [Anaerolineae bacterium]|mgnify:CR=1 FL=1|nr:TetR/AcrR family transcriptional regulator [Anaerolineae bacterium]